MVDNTLSSGKKRAHSNDTLLNISLKGNPQSLKRQLSATKKATVSPSTVS
jgi:hypothetical protein